MIRTLNFICLATTGLVCLGLYHLAEQARVAEVELRTTKVAIDREQDSLTVLGAEWARVTQPGRIHALAQKHLTLIDRPSLQLTTLAQLPRKDMPFAAPDDRIRTAKAVTAPGSAKARTVAFVPSSVGR